MHAEHRFLSKYLVFKQELVWSSIVPGGAVITRVFFLGGSSGVNEVGREEVGRFALDLVGLVCIILAI